MSPELLTLPQIESGTTATVLLDTAERLFAQKGIETVSLRQIVIASGHGNQSGAHYHFGSREVLIRKLLERRMFVVDAVRHQVLDRLVSEGRDGDLSVIIGSTVHLLETVVRDYAWGANYVRITAQALFNSHMNLFAGIDAAAVSGLHRTSRMARKLLPHLPLHTFDERMRLVRFNAVSEFSRWFHTHHALNSETQTSFDSMVANVAAYVTAGLAAPVPAGDWYA